MEGLDDAKVVHAQASAPTQHERRAPVGLREREREQHDHEQHDHERRGHGRRGHERRDHGRRASAPAPPLSMSVERGPVGLARVQCTQWWSVRFVLPCRKITPTCLRAPCPGCT